MQRLVDVLGDPQHAYPVIHITGTNGKGSTAQIVTRLLVAQGLRVGTYTSPHLERVNERIARDGEPIADDDLAEEIAAIADARGLLGVRPSYFEILTAAAFRWFADVAVDVAVVEVGLLGRWDATNVADGQVAVSRTSGSTTPSSLGPTPRDIADGEGRHREAGRFARARRDRSRPRADLPGRAPGAACSARRRLRRATTTSLALGGRLLDLRTPGARTRAVPPAARRAPGRQRRGSRWPRSRASSAPLSTRASSPRAFADVSMPGRFEVVGRQPLVVARRRAQPCRRRRAPRQSLDEDFGDAGERILVVGLLERPRPRRDARGARRRARRGCVIAARRRRRARSRPRRPRRAARRASASTSSSSTT